MPNTPPTPSPDSRHPAAPNHPEASPPAGILAALRSLGPHRTLFLLLTIATFFEGFDTKLASLVLPVIGQEFGASQEELGTALGLSSMGMVFAFFVLHLADWIGRRPLFLIALVAYAVLTLATAFAPTLWVFTILQVFARMAMVVELGLAYLILSEEMPPAIRGRVNGLLGAFAALGASVPAALLSPLQALEIGWRGLFLIGALPLGLLPLYFRKLPETRAFLAREARRFSLAHELELARALLAHAHRARLLGITAIWFAINFWSGTALYFFTLYVFGERGWDAEDLLKLPLGTIPFGLLGYALAGFIMDGLGRRGAASLYLVAAFLATALCYQTTNTALIYLGYFVLIGLGGIWTIATTWTAELFPTELRATALGLTNNLLGRFGLVIGPIVAGRLSAALDSTADAIVILAGTTLAVLPVVWLLPETNAIDLSGSDSEPDDA